MLTKLEVEKEFKDKLAKKELEIAELKSRITEELNSKLDELKAELFNLRFQHATNQLDNPRVITEVKRTIARVKTILRERELNQTV